MHRPVATVHHAPRVRRTRRRRGGGALPSATAGCSPRRSTTTASHELRAWVDEIAEWPDDGDGWLHHHELTDDGPKLCRSENLIPFHDGPARPAHRRVAARRRLGAARLSRRCSTRRRSTTSCPVVPATRPHQDAPAYPFIEAHVSCMVAIDDATLDNGCLEVVSGTPPGGAADGRRPGASRPTSSRRCEWDPVEVRAGQTLWFHSRTPHRSGPNRSPTAAPGAVPDLQRAAPRATCATDYYRQKLAEFAEGCGARRPRAGLADRRLPGATGP